MSWVQNKREPLACRSGHKTESVEPTVKAREGETDQRNVRKKNLRQIERKSRNTKSLEEKFLGGRLGTVMLSMEHPRQRGNHTTERNTAEM